jgi:hypothetical protein
VIHPGLTTWDRNKKGESPDAQQNSPALKNYRRPLDPLLAELFRSPRGLDLTNVIDPASLSEIVQGVLTSDKRGMQRADQKEVMAIKITLYEHFFHSLICPFLQLNGERKQRGMFNDSFVFFTLDKYIKALLRKAEASFDGIECINNFSSISKTFKKVIRGVIGVVKNQEKSACSGPYQAQLPCEPGLSGSLFSYVPCHGYGTAIHHRRRRVLSE